MQRLIAVYNHHKYRYNVLLWLKADTKYVTKTSIHHRFLHQYINPIWKQREIITNTYSYFRVRMANPYNIVRLHPKRDKRKRKYKIKTKKKLLNHEPWLMNSMILIFSSAGKQTLSYFSSEFRHTSHNIYTYSPYIYIYATIVTQRNGEK